MVADQTWMAPISPSSLSACQYESIDSSRPLQYNGASYRERLVLYRL